MVKNQRIRKIFFHCWLVSGCLDWCMTLSTKTTAPWALTLECPKCCLLIFLIWGFRLRIASITKGWKQLCHRPLIILFLCIISAQFDYLNNDCCRINSNNQPLNPSLILYHNYHRSTFFKKTILRNMMWH